MTTINWGDEEKHRQEAARECEAIALDLATRWNRAESVREMQMWQAACETIAREIRRRFALQQL